ncbi:MGMT family protein [Streptomyces sp. NBC_00820]|nr:MGMT family protein [Streptomyces sp. NBC_00820]
MSIIEDVREAVIAIPPGLVASYGDIGKRIGAGRRRACGGRNGTARTADPSPRPA